MTGMQATATQAAESRRLDSGLALLCGGVGVGGLRWAPCPGAPDSRSLVPGEFRVSVCNLDLDRRTLGAWRALDLRRRSASGVLCWCVIPAWGRGIVTESMSEQAPLGQAVQGMMHLGTHWVGARSACVSATEIPPFDAALPVQGTLPEVRFLCEGFDAIAEALEAWRDHDHGAVHVPASAAGAGSRRAIEGR